MVSVQKRLTTRISIPLRCSSSHNHSPTKEGGDCGGNCGVVVVLETKKKSVAVRSKSPV